MCNKNNVTNDRNSRRLPGTTMKEANAWSARAGMGFRATEANFLKARNRKVR